MNKTDFIDNIKPAIENGTLLTAKHDPNLVETQYHDYRSVLTLEASASLKSFILSGNYGLTCYHDNKYPNGAGYFEITPSDTAAFTIAGYGVVSSSLENNTNLDRLVIVSGSKTGWHLYAEDSNVIAKHIETGRLTSIQP